MHSYFGSTERSPDEWRNDTDIEESSRQWQQTNHRQDNPTFFSAFEALDRFEPHALISTWLYRIAYNHAMMLIRRRHAVDPLPEEEEDATLFPVQLVDWSHLPDQYVLSGESQEVLRAAINDLPLGLRAAFILRDLEGLSTAECAHVQELTESACKVRLHRARLSLREHLSVYFSERSGAHSEEIP